MIVPAVQVRPDLLKELAELCSCDELQVRTFADPVLIEIQISVRAETCIYCESLRTIRMLTKQLETLREAAARATEALSDRNRDFLRLLERGGPL